MPKVLVVGPFRFFFFSNEGTEPPHVHVQRDNKTAKFWLSPVCLEDPGDFKPAEIQKIKNLVFQHRRTIIEKWNEFFNKNEAI